MDEDGEEDEDGDEDEDEDEEQDGDDGDEDENAHEVRDENNVYLALLYCHTTPLTILSDHLYQSIIKPMRLRTY